MNTAKTRPIDLSKKRGVSTPFDRSTNMNKLMNILKEYEVLTAEEELELIKKSRNGCQASKDKLVNHNLKFVVSVAKTYYCKNLNIEDLVNEGTIGLIKAIERFDETRGFKFISYAVWWIRQSILKAIHESDDLIRKPVNVICGTSELKRLINDFALENGFPPDDDYVIERSPYTVQITKSIIDNINGNTVSGDKLLSDDGGMSYFDVILEEQPIDYKEYSMLWASINVYADSLDSELKRNSLKIFLKTFNYKLTANELKENRGAVYERIFRLLKDYRKKHGRKILDSINN